MVLLDFSMSPMDKGASVSPYVARVVAVVAASGLDYQLHAMGTILEGEWEEVFGVVRRCFETLKTDCHRITCTIKVDYRDGPAGRLRGKVERVQELVKQPLQTG